MSISYFKARLYLNVDIIDSSRSSLVNQTGRKHSDPNILRSLPRHSINSKSIELKRDGFHRRLKSKYDQQPAVHYHLM